MKKDVSIKAGGIIFNSSLDKVVMILNRESHMKGENKWGLPKGHLKQGESIFYGAKREIKEETGLLINLKKRNRCIKINDCYYYIVILSKQMQIQPIDKNEIFKCEWINLQDINNLNLNYDTRSVFKQTKLEKVKDIINNQESIICKVF